MFTHYLKIAFRNMRKYKNQTFISVIGLAVGFTCFALAMLWIRYEMTFDSFHKNAGQMYVVYKPDTQSQTGYNWKTPPLLAAHLKETFPEIVNAVTFNYSKNSYVVEEVEIPVLIISGDSSLLKMFDVKILEGSTEFLIPGNYSKLAITDEKARQLYGSENPIGKTVSNIYYNRFTICAVVSGMPKQSNFVFDFIRPKDTYGNSSWNYSNQFTTIELLPGINLEAFEKKIYEHDTGKERGNISKMKITPLTKMRYLDPDVEREVKFQHIVIFAMSGLLVIVCALFNYLTLFMSRFRIRQKEMALRVVHGASGGSLLTMLSIEFLLMLLLTVVLGCTLTQWLYKPFLTLTDIQMNLSDIYLESFMYFGCIILVSMLIFWVILFVFRMRMLDVSIRRSNKKLFRKISIIVQLVISIGFAFCTIVILKQMYFLHHSGELGFSFRDRGSMVLMDNPEGSTEGLAHKLRQIPEIVEVVDIYAEGLFTIIPERYVPDFEVLSWDDKPVDSEVKQMWKYQVTPEIVDFYNFQLKAGEMLTDADPASLVLINESAVKLFGWHDAVGKQFNGYTVKGVIKNVYNTAPTIPAKPLCYLKHIPPAPPSTVESTIDSETVIFRIIMHRSIMFRYHEGMWESCREKIRQLVEKEHPNISRYLELYNTEEEYNNFLKSENALIRLLSLVSAICVLICVFGFVSLVSLTCEERRKEIAIRKINGATAGDILAMFAKEYSLLLIIGAVIAFPAGWLIMQRWLENYVKQTSIPAWIYLSIILVLALVIVLCVGWRVYRASVENPADVVKSE